jgi:hypothetical protein
VSFCFGGLPGLLGLGFAGFSCWGGIAGVAGAAGFGAGRAGTAGIARVLEWRVFFARACRPRVALPRPFELVAAGGGVAAEACAASVDGPPDGVLPPPPGLGWPGTGEPGTGEPGTGEPGTGEPGTGEPGTGEPGTGTETPPPGETNTGVKPANGDGDTVGLALRGLAGSTSAGTLRSCVPGRASSRIAERSSTERACIHSCADATAPAVTAAT